MVHPFSSSYPWGHETSSNSRAIRTAASPSRPFVAAGQKSNHHRPDGGCQPGIGVALGANLSSRGNVGLARPPRSGAPLLPFRRAEDSPRPSLTAWRTSCRVPNRVVDLEAHCQSNLERVSGALPSQRALASLEWHGLELSEAQAPRLSTRRGRDCPLAPLSVAAYKKRPRSWARTWFSWMKVAFCSSPPSNAPGRPKDRLSTPPTMLLNVP